MVPYTCFMTLSPSQFGSQPVYTGPGLAGRDSHHWSKYALAERRTVEASKEPGGKWGFQVALVPVSQLAKYREFDRTKAPYGYADSNETISSIADDLRKGGTGALRSPISISYDHKNKWGYIAEGNHRVAAAIQAGVSHLPVQIGGNSNAGLLDDLKAKGVGAPLHLDTRLVEGDTGYFPSYQHPGNFKEFEGAR